MREGQEQRSTQMPWPLRIRPLTITAGVATTALVLLAVLVPSDVTAWRYLPSPEPLAQLAWLWSPYG